MSCVDVDECANTKKKVCPDKALCTNTVGSYKCTCPDGYTYKDEECIRKY